MRAVIALALGIFIFSCAIAPEIHPFVVVWDIGQGQWVSVITNDVCLHFDMGGELSFQHDRGHRRYSRNGSRSPHFGPHFGPPPVLRFCLTKKNRVYLSHSDLDHIKFLPWGAVHLPQLCDAAPPLDPMNKRKKALVATVPLCHRPLQTREVRVVEITPNFAADLESQKFKGANDFSRIFIVYGPDRAVLIPGDSTAEAEKIWSKRLIDLPPVQILVAGHHGSRTSTSEILLQRLPGLKIAIASARKARYGHPAPEVVARLRADGVPLLRTEIWGNIALEL